MDWFPYDNGLRHERVNATSSVEYQKIYISYVRCQILLVFGVSNTPGLKNSQSLISHTEVSFSWNLYKRKILEFHTP